jgi:hypothetical protein
MLKKTLRCRKKSGDDEMKEAVQKCLGDKHKKCNLTEFLNLWNVEPNALKRKENYVEK